MSQHFILQFLTQQPHLLCLLRVPEGQQKGLRSAITTTHLPGNLIQDLTIQKLLIPAVIEDHNPVHAGPSIIASLGRKRR